VWSGWPDAIRLHGRERVPLQQQGQQQQQQQKQQQQAHKELGQR
jgi:hypothetical protein